MINLPKPVRKLEDKTTYYFISNETAFTEYGIKYADCNISSVTNYADKNEYYFRGFTENIHLLLNNGQLFETEEDAQAWLDFMTNYGKEE